MSVRISPSVTFFSAIFFVNEDNDKEDNKDKDNEDNDYKDNNNEDNC